MFFYLQPSGFSSFRSNGLQYFNSIPVCVTPLKDVTSSINSLLSRLLGSHDGNYTDNHLLKRGIIMCNIV